MASSWPNIGGVASFPFTTHTRGAPPEVPGTTQSKPLVQTCYPRRPKHCHRHFGQPSRGGIGRGIKCPKFSLGLARPPFPGPVFLHPRTAKPVHPLLAAATTPPAADLKLIRPAPFTKSGHHGRINPKRNPYSKLQPPISGSETHSPLQGIKGVWKKFIKMPNKRADEGCCMQPRWDSEFTVVPAESTAAECSKSGKGLIQALSFVYPLRTT